VSAQTKIARVALDTRLPQLDRLFDYLIPVGVEVSVGVRVKVPLRSKDRLHPGYVIEIVEDSEHPEALHPLAECVSPVRVLTPELWQLARTVASRQAGNVSDVLRLAIPGRYVRVEKAWLAREDTDSLAPEVTAPVELDGYPKGSLEKLLNPGSRFLLAQPGGRVGHGQQERQSATLPVASLALATLSRGQSTTIVVPDWRDIEFYRQALQDVIPASNLVVWDQGRTTAGKYQQYLRTLEQKPQVVLGSRHTIYAPVFDLGLIVVVDDADEAHQEQLAPYPHTRDIAMVRHQQTQCSVVFASLVPSLNTLRWVEMGYFQALSPIKPNRPTVIPTALALGHDQTMAPGRLPSQAHQGAKEGLRDGPVLIQVFRAGFAPGLSCQACGESARCAHCAGPLRWESPTSRPSCAWCAKTAVSWKCSECGAGALKPRGSGVGRTVSDLGKAFPGISIIRADGSQPLLRVGNSPALVVATRGAEPVADGGYSAALLLDGGAMLQRESLGALEDCLRGWEHAISLVRPEGTVFITDIDQSPALAVATGNYQHLLRTELRARESLRLPPAVRFCSLTGPAPVVAAMAETVGAISDQIDRLGPVGVGEGLVRTVLRFPYSLGEAVQKSVRSAYLKALSGPKTAAKDRLRVVFDNPRSLDLLTSE